MSNTQNFDIIIIGSGPGGYVAAIRAAQLGLKTAVVERESLGGICLNWGCIPTKALLKSAQVFEYLLHAKEYGIEAENPKADFDAVMKRSRKVANKMNSGIQFLFKKNKITHLQGTAQLLNANTVQVTDNEQKTQNYTAPHIVIATGARSRSLPTVPQDGTKIIGYREALALPKRPESMLIIGAGAIGVEFAYFYNAMGTKVTMVEYAPNILPLEDAEISKELENQYKKNGITVLTNTQALSVNTQGAGCKIILQHNETKATTELQTDIVLSAVGFVANIENLGLEKLNITLDKGKIATNDFYETNVKGVYAIGDVTKGQALAHVASAEAIICVEKIAGHHPEPLNYANIPGCTYCIPEVASVGYTQQQAIDAGYKIKVGKFPFSASGKASAAGHNVGFVKVIFDEKYGEFLGAHLIGANVTEMIAEVVVARKLETTAHEIIKAVHPHPTMSEAIMEAAAAAYGEVIHI